MNIASLGWGKAAGAAGSLRIAGKLGARPVVDQVVLSAPGLSASGGLKFDARGDLELARFDRLRVGRWLNAPVSVRPRGGARPPAVTIKGGSVDLRHAPFENSGGDSGPLELQLDRLQITEGIALTDFRGAFAAGQGMSGQFQARVNGQTAVAGTVVPFEGRAGIRLRSDDAGGVFRAAGLARNASGGSLDVTLQPATGAGIYDGQLAIRGLRLRDAPAMAALLDAISVVGLLRQLDGQGLAIDEVDASFRITPQRLIVTESSAVGPGLGISLDGIYTLASQTLNMQGVVSPFYLLNGIGSVLTRRGEGLIGFSFTVDGSVNAPEVNVNPLSALTPGMFREIFRRAPPVVSP